MITGRLHSIETFGAVDGPGIRTIFFMQGCPARCIYCHNPDTWKYTGGEEITAQAVLDTALRSKPYYGKDGGVTFSGGEPLLQGKFILECIKMFKKNGIGTVIDTSGTHIDEYTEAVVCESDMLLLDVKHSNSKEFSRISGCSQKKLLKLIKIANQYDKPVWLRQVIVPGINDNKDNIKLLADFSREKIKNLYNVELLGYHTLGVDKYKELGLKYRLEGIKPMEKRNLTNLTKLLNHSLYSR